MGSSIVFCKAVDYPSGKERAAALQEEEEAVSGNDEGWESPFPKEAHAYHLGCWKGLFCGPPSGSDFITHEDVTGRNGPRAKLASMASGL